MKNIDYSNQIQKEAILNECKGNLFEFLVAQGLAVRSKLEDDFLLNLPPDFKSRLLFYEELMRTHQPKLLVSLPKLADQTVAQILKDSNIASLEFKHWNVIGKMMATNDNEFWNETDIVGTYNRLGENKKLTLSLKLTKEHSFTNTKSAGVKSFLIKYFSSYELAHKSLLSSLQHELNEEVDSSFLKMGHKLYGLIDAEFKGSFDSTWSAQYSELPGELSEDMRAVVHENYHRVALKLSTILNKLKECDSELFFKSLFSLCGFGHSEIIQVNCFHQDYELKGIRIKKFDDFFLSQSDKFAILPIKNMASSVEVIIGSLFLQLRVKPMNKFTTAAYKINCSIKVKDE